MKRINKEWHQISFILFFMLLFFFLTIKSIESTSECRRVIIATSYFSHHNSKLDKFFNKLHPLNKLQWFCLLKQKGRGLRISTREYAVVIYPKSANIFLSFPSCHHLTHLKIYIYSIHPCITLHWIPPPSFQ